ncbi:MAG: hypothetical protein K8R02_00365 [Anaerohalosphaeraceae bacterium]|nr:hypothetical protein [Anaerohalosphaeraceae bacterium]
MYNKRLKQFVYFFAIVAIICIGRLAYIQLNPKSVWQGQLEKIRRGSTRDLPSLRGEILDRNGKILAGDEAKFTLCIDYKYARLADDRFWKAQTLRRLNRGKTYAQADEQIKKDYSEDFNTLFEMIEKCAAFAGKTPEEMKAQINKKINAPLWRLREHLAWKRKYPEAESFSLAQPSTDKRLLLAYEVDLAEMHQPQKLITFDNDDQMLAAQLTLINVEGVKIMPKPERLYPYKQTASQLIGWVRPWNPDEEQIFAEHELEKYRHGDIAGFSGIEYICESVLRGKRGKIVYNIDNEIVRRDETQFGQAVQLTIDIELQDKIEKRFKNCAMNQYCKKPAAAVVIDVNSGDVLAMVSLPCFDLNKARSNYGTLCSDPNKPTIDRTINNRYPPGSTAKPIILAMGMQEGKIGPGDTIACTSEPAPRGWPRCWYERKYHLGHSDQWGYEGGNSARNAIRGSCNIYFSHLAVRLSPKKLQRWLWDFGFGHNALDVPEEFSYGDGRQRTFRQMAGVISSRIPDDCSSLESLPPITSAERRFFGIGQGNFRATPLQVANAFATIARDGIYKKAKIFAGQNDAGLKNLEMSETTLMTIRDGMRAVVSADGGTAYKQFRNSGFEEKGITVFGKTGSTEKPYNAWFAGFAEDKKRNAIAVVVLVEGGQHGSSDAAPIGRDIISFCIEAGYLDGQ